MTALLAVCTPETETGDLPELTEAQFLELEQKAAKGDLQAHHSLQLFSLSQGQYARAVKWAQRGVELGDCDSLLMLIELKTVCAADVPKQTLSNARAKLECAEVENAYRL